MAQRAYGAPILCLILPVFLAGAALAQSGHTSLRHSVNAALLYNPGFKAVQEDYQASAFALDKAKAGRMPSAHVNFGGGFTQRSDTITKAIDANNDWELTGEYGLYLVQPLWRGGAVIGNVRLYEFLFSSADYNLANEGTNMAYSAILAHVEVLRRARLLELSNINISEHEKILRIMQQRYDSKIATIGELSQVQNRRARALATRSAYQKAYDDACSAYLRATGKNPAGLLPPAPPQKTYPSLQFARSACLKGNLRLKAAADNLFATEQEKNIAKSAYWPQLDLELGHYWNDREGDLSESAHGLGAMLRLNWEFFSGGRDKANVSMSAARLRQAKQTLYALMDSLNEEVESTYSAYLSSQTQALEYARAKEASIRTKADYNRQFLSARRSIVDVLDAENDFFYAAGQEILNEYDKILAAYRILALSGELLSELGVDAQSLRPAKPTTSEHTGKLIGDSPSSLNTLRTPE